ncbi:MAG: UbiA family prenyltransferase, partial [Psychroflexus sp.]
MSFLNLIKWKKIAMLILMALLMRFCLLPYFVFEIQIDNFEFALLILALVFILAAANIVNQVYNSVAIQINNPEKLLIPNKFSQKISLFLYFLFNALGLISALAFAFLVNSNKNWLLFSCIILGVILYLAYAIYFKNLAILGNFVKSFLSAFSIIIIGFSIFNLQNHPFLVFFISIFALSLFLLNFVSLILKNIIEIQGDYFARKSTLPILIGKKRSQLVAFFLIIISVLLIISTTLAYFIDKNLLMFYVFVA